MTENFSLGYQKGQEHCLTESLPFELIEHPSLADF
uniref:Uncharacterized protein n=1 Tax=Nymphaea colorata TaxID=210225 RepID=A0A5K0ZIE5_9MAGN